MFSLNILCLGFHTNNLETPPYGLRLGLGLGWGWVGVGLGLDWGWIGVGLGLVIIRNKANSVRLN